MLVNTIAFYPRPLRRIEHATVANDNQFGAPVLHYTVFLSQSAVENGQAFGTPQIAVTRRYLRPVAIANAQSFGDNQVQVRSRTYLNPTAVTNASAFGSHKFRKKLLESVFSNASTFGSHTISSAAKKYRYSNSLGTGDRTATITVTTAGVSVSNGPASKLVDGSTASNPFFSGSGSFKFDLGSAKVIKQVRWKQTNSTSHGLWKWQGSNDDSTYTDIGGAFTLGGATINIHHTLIDNETAYRYYKLVSTTGAMSASPDIQEVEFFIEGTTNDEPDTSYLYPCGGGIGAGGATVNGSGGNGTDRNTLIIVTSNYSTSDGIDPHNIIDGAGGNNGTDSISFGGNLSSASIIFDFAPSGRKQRINEFTWEQSNSTGQGNWDWSGSDDAINWTDISTNFSLVNGSSQNVVSFTNTTAYRFYRLKYRSGTTSNSPWIHEIYFKCAPGVKSTDVLSGMPSYANAGGMGDRTASITVTTDAELGGGTVSNAVDGVSAANDNDGFWFSAGQSGKYLKFDFGSAKVINEIRWIQQNTSDQHTWQAAGSNDDSSYTNIGSSQQIGGWYSASTCKIGVPNTTAHRYYKLTNAGGMSSNPYIQEIEFSIA